jgi:pentatricopeptide repeat protein
LRRLRLLLPGVWLAIVLLLFLQNSVFVFGAGFYHPYYPLEVYDFIRAEVPSQNLFNEMRYGGSMLWWLYPRFKPFIDGRGDAFSEQFWKTEYLPVISSRPESQEILAKYNVTGALLPVYEDRTLPPLARTLHADKDWALVAFNDHTLFFLRRTAANEGVIARREFRLIWPGDSSLAAMDAPGTRAQATAEAKRAFEFSSDSPFARTAVARAYFVNEQFAPAAVILREFASQKDAGVNYLRDFGYALFRLGQYREADKVFARMVRRNLLPGFAGYMRHFIALEEGRSADARRFLGEAIKAEPGNREYREALSHLASRPSGPSQPRQ